MGKTPEFNHCRACAAKSLRAYAEDEGEPQLANDPELAEEEAFLYVQANRMARARRVLLMAGVLTTRDVADLLHCSVQVVRELALARRLRAFRLRPNGHWRFKRADVDAYIQDQKSYADRQD